MWTRTDSRVREYEALPLFAGCSRLQLRQVSRAATRLSLGAGTVLVRQGERPRQFVIVLGGTAEVWRNGQPIDEIGAGELLRRDRAHPADPRTSEHRCQCRDDRRRHRIARTSSQSRSSSSSTPTSPWSASVWTTSSTGAWRNGSQHPTRVRSMLQRLARSCSRRRQQCRPPLISAAATPPTSSRTIRSEPP